MSTLGRVSLVLGEEDPESPSCRRMGFPPRGMLKVLLKACQGLSKERPCRKGMGRMKQASHQRSYPLPPRLPTRPELTLCRSITAGVQIVLHII